MRAAGRGEKRGQGYREGEVVESVGSEVEGSEPLIGQVVLEELDLVVDPRTKSLMPNPRSPELPMVEIL
jgi:hypothetical protein